MSGQGKTWLSLLVFLFLCLGAGWLGSIVTRPAIPEWYVHLQKPSWTPPPWVFGPVWTTLYVMMAIAGWHVWRKEAWSFAVVVFFTQLAVNASWSWLFFGLRRPDLGLLGLVVLVLLVLTTILSFWRVSHFAAGLMAPYGLWVTFAAALNYEIWRLNR
jgi:tryptophan-rich sensory protein